MSKVRQCVSSAEAVTRRTQHKKPCSDCPWARKSLRGWLGGLLPQTWLQIAFGEAKEPCHTISNQQCAGLAVFRKNICKSPRDKSILVLPKNTTLVFATATEFLSHHSKEPEVCGECHGSGEDPDCLGESCENCDGSGLQPKP